MASDAPKVFISYSHDSLEHARRVLGLAERLRNDGKAHASLHQARGVGMPQRMETDGGIDLRRTARGDLHVSPARR